MRAELLYDEAKLRALAASQKAHHWDLEDSINWSQRIDLARPLVALDQNALFFPGASSQQRVAISQLMGLIIASSICEMEECLIRFKPLLWDRTLDDFPVSPEFRELGELFFEEEQKHSAAFRRYLHRYAEALGIDYELLHSLLPQVKGSFSESWLKKDIESGGVAFWWIVAIVEVQFLIIYQSLKPFSQTLEPLYFDLHQKHFEEEARHISFPYFMIHLLLTRREGVTAILHRKLDLMQAQFIQASWAIGSLSSTQKKIKDLTLDHPWIQELQGVFSLREGQGVLKTVYELITTTPYISSLVNIEGHRKILEFAKSLGASRIPFPGFTPSKLVKY